MPAGHGPVQDGMIRFIQEVIDPQFGRSTEIPDPERPAGREVVHEIGIEPVPPGKVVTGGGKPLAVGVVLPGQKVAPEREVY